jgi:hypothetical protein
VLGIDPEFEQTVESRMEGLPLELKTADLIPIEGIYMADIKDPAMTARQRPIEQPGGMYGAEQGVGQLAGRIQFSRQHVHKAGSKREGHSAGNCSPHQPRTVVIGVLRVWL